MIRQPLLRSLAARFVESTSCHAWRLASRSSSACRRAASGAAGGAGAAARSATAGLLVLLLAACAAEPPHRPPTLELPTDFRYIDGWQRSDAAPQAIVADWWAPYEDPVLARLLRDVAEANATVAQARARHQQALTQIDAARAGALPTVDGTAGFTRANRSSFGTRLYQAGLTVAWAPDVWGRTALATDAALADADAAAADLAAARLALQLTASQGYIRLRTIDLHQELLTRSLTAYDRSLQLTRRQHEAGLVARSDVIQAETQLQALRAQQVSTARQRLLEENALALLAGRTPSELRLAQRPGALPAVPLTPAELPSALLVRRPDVAAAERQIAAVHARLGIARKAWLPTLTLGASGGVQSSRWRDLLDAPARVWSLGPSLAANLFDGGTRRAETARLEAVYDEQVQVWRASVLEGVRETEDALGSLLSLAEEGAQQQRLVDLAEHNERVVTHRYEAGEITFLEVATAQNLALQSRRTALDVEAERLLASMRLIAALGGGWTTTSP